MRQIPPFDSLTQSVRSLRAFGSSFLQRDSLRVTRGVTSHISHLTSRSFLS